MYTDYLVKRRQTWYVNVRVPPKLEPIIGKQNLQRSLKTRDLAQANLLKHAVIHEFKSFINAVKQAVEKGEPVTELFITSKSLTEEVNLSDVIQTEQTVLIPLSAHGPDRKLLSDTLDDYLADVSKHIRIQTYKAKEKRIRDFMKWLKVDKEPHKVAKKDAGLFLTHDLSQRDLSTKSIKDFLSDLSAFFGWMEGRGIVENNPFKGLSGTVRNTSRGLKSNTKRREWTEHELLTLLGNLKTKKDQKLTAMTLIALYSGMRSNEIAELELRDVNDVYFHIPEGKTESSIRDVPIHPIIRPLISHLKTTSKDGYLISGLKRGGEDQKRNHYAVKRFGDFKRSIGITSEAVVFHSLRKNFSGELERAGIPENLAQQIVGHKKQSLTYGLYSQGVRIEQLLDAVSKVTHGSKVDELTKDVIMSSMRLGN
jgi:integrase